MADHRKAGPSRPPKKRPTSTPRGRREDVGPRSGPSRGPAPREPRHEDDPALEASPVDPADDEFGIRNSADYEPPPRHRRLDNARPQREEPRQAREPAVRNDRDARGPDRRPEPTQAPRENLRDARVSETHSDSEPHPLDEADDRDDVRPENAPAPRPAQPAVGGPPPRPSDGYTVQVFFDRQSRQFVATALEVPEIKVTGRQAELVLEELLDRLDTHLDGLKGRGDRIPEAFQMRKTYPETLSLPISQTLFRKLDVLSRQEKIAFEQLVTELLASGIERRFEMPRAGGARPPQQGQGHNENRGNQRHGHRDRGGRGGGGGENRGNNRRFNNDSMGSGDNFMEYVRNLEKGGGTPGRGNWRKR